MLPLRLSIKGDKRMSNNTFLTDSGEHIDINDIAPNRPFGWRGDIIVSGVTMIDGIVREVTEAEYYGVYWHVGNGSKHWIADFSEKSIAKEFACKLESAALIFLLKHQIYQHKAVIYQLENKSFRKFENECDVPADESGRAWTWARLRILNGQ